MESGPESGGINRDEWLKALAEVAADADADAGPTDAITTRELATMMGCSIDAAQDRMKRLLIAGKAVQTRKWLRDARGARQPVIAYRLVKDDAHEGH